MHDIKIYDESTQQAQHNVHMHALVTASLPTQEFIELLAAALRLNA